QSSGSIGLTLFYVTWLLGFVRWFVRQSTEIENSIVSVERILDYTNLKPEWNAKSNEKNILKIDKLEHWPKAGTIEFNDVSLIYVKNSTLALKNLSFKIQAGEKVGIVGRSGAGKSSILNVLERLYEFRGQILIDDVDIRLIDLYEIRKRITVIPQESILFGGTLRKNLDPFDEFSDDQLWKALEQVKIKSTFKNATACSLDMHLSDSGLNLSVGQRQLICLARAMLEKNKVVLIDEATSHIDPITDTIMQNLIAEQFRESTILIIAHRLRTIMNCTKIMVIKDGQLVEMGEPTVLDHKIDGHFYKLLKESAN
uniref:ABC transporter domain-containing protein n=1 Tax=Romanomermis culicivorax TaxID=13658 RepID=A0A915JJP9_ROMCU